MIFVYNHIDIILTTLLLPARQPRPQSELYPHNQLIGSILIITLYSCSYVLLRYSSVGFPGHTVAEVG